MSSDRVPARLFAVVVAAAALALAADCSPAAIPATSGDAPREPTGPRPRAFAFACGHDVLDDPAQAREERMFRRAFDDELPVLFRGYAVPAPPPEVLRRLEQDLHVLPKSARTLAATMGAGGQLGLALTVYLAAEAARQKAGAAPSPELAEVVVALPAEAARQGVVLGMLQQGCPAPPLTSDQLRTAAAMPRARALSYVSAIAAKAPR